MSSPAVSRASIDASKLLFKIETNLNYAWENPFVSSAEHDEINQVLTCFKLPKAVLIQRIKKRNLLSQVFRVNENLILRRVDGRQAGLVESQCQIIRLANLKNMISPCKSNEGQFTVNLSNSCWIAYPYIDAPVMTGREQNILQIIEQCLEILHLISQVKAGTTFCVNHKPKQWVATFRNLPAYFYEEPFTKLASQETVQFFKENIKAVLPVIEDISRLDTRSDITPVHNDLNHSNILTGKDQVYAIDLEDICQENPAISAAHCIFKLLRHGVYAGAIDFSIIRTHYLPPIINLLARHKSAINSVESFYRYAQYRIASDIQYIINRIIDQKVSKLPTDLEKKIHNFFELNLMCFGRT